MEWPATYLGSVSVRNLQLDLDDVLSPKLNLTDETIASSRELRKLKQKSEILNVSVITESLRGCQPESHAVAFYQPTGKVIFVLSHMEGTLKKSAYFSFIAAEESSCVSGPSARYLCHTFRCKSEQEANELAFAARRTITLNNQRERPSDLDNAQLDQLEAAVLWWNASNAPLYHFAVSKQDNSISGNMKMLCQVDPKLKTAQKVVKLNSHVRGEELILLLAEKFNLGNINCAEFAVYDHKENEQVMLEDHESPVLNALKWSDPSEGSFWLKRLPASLVRIPTNKTPRASQLSSTNGSVLPANSSTSAPHTRDTAHAANTSTANNASTGNTSTATATPVSNRAGSGRPSEDGGSEAGSEQDARMAALGPLLPYHPDDEDLLLSVMISRQSGSGLGFKLTPAYLLQMCISYCTLNLGHQHLKNLLMNVASQISAVVAEQPTNPEMLLFWATNSLKLSSTLVKDPEINAVFVPDAKPVLDEATEQCLKHIKACAAANMPLPSPLDKAEWSTQAELKAVIIDYYRALDANMSHESLQDVVARITEAIPSPNKKPSQASINVTEASPPAAAEKKGLPLEALDTSEVEQKDWEEFQKSRENQNFSAINASQKLGFSASPNSAPLTSTPLGRNSSADSPSVSTIQDSEPNVPRTETHYSPLPEEWEELIDQETQHRFFANHVTRQTSWTDPRDRLVTVTLVKGDRGLGLGISGAKRTHDDRLILGIFVSSLVPGSAAHTEGTLIEGDEILEVNGHSLIGVSREGAIEFLKQVKQGGKVLLLVSQEPLPQDKSEATKLRHTAL